MSVGRMFNRRFRGFRIVNVSAAIVLTVLMVGLYLAKTRAAKDSAAITRIERQMGAERNSIRMLKAEAARLENPERIEQLAVRYLSMAPSQAEREATPDQLAAVAAGAMAPPAPPAPVAAKP